MVSVGGHSLHSRGISSSSHPHHPHPIMMDTQSNLLRPSLSVSPYSSPTVTSLPPTTSPPDPSSRSPRAPNGWNYGNPVGGSAGNNGSTDTSPVVSSHLPGGGGGGGCNFTPYGSSLGVSSTMASSMHKSPSGYSSYPSLSTSNMSDFLPNCQNIMQNHNALTPLHTSLNTMQSISASRNFPFYPGDVYQTNPHHGMPGSGLFPDLSIPSIPRFDADTAPTYAGGLGDNSQNSGKLCFMFIPLAIESPSHISSLISYVFHIIFIHFTRFCASSIHFVFISYHHFISFSFYIIISIRPHSLVKDKPSKC
jgi:hypothetical protein